MSVIAIGDIHGCAGSLEALLDVLEPAPDDHLVFVGDYIDRGPDSKAVIDRLLDLRATHHCTFLRGNHEALRLEYLDHGREELWHVNGGLNTLRSYASGFRRRALIPDEHEQFVRDTEMYLDTDEAFFVHAGLKPHLSVAENLERYGSDVFLWERGHLDADHLAWEKPVVCGHTPLEEPLNRNLLVAIDTGCVYYTRPQFGRLTAVYLPDREFVTVPYAG